MGVYLGSDPISLYLGGQGKEAEDINPELTEQETLIQNIQEALVGKTYGANATPETILKGYSAYVHQNLVEGTLELPEPGIDLLGATGYTKIAVDKFTFSSRTLINGSVLSHSLGEQPKIALVFAKTNSGIQWDLRMMVCAIQSGNRGTLTLFSYYDATKEYSISYNSNFSVTYSESSLTLALNSSTFYFASGVEYTLITLA